MTGGLDREHYEGNILDEQEALFRRINALERDLRGAAVHGNCYGHHIAWSQVCVQNTWYNVSDSDVVDGLLYNCTHDGSGLLTVEKAGIYLIPYSLCFAANGANDHVEVGIEISSSGSAESPGITHTEAKFANEEEHVGGVALLSLAASATVEMAVRSTDAGTTITVEGFNLNVIMIG